MYTAPIKTTGRNLAGLWRPSFVKVDQRLYVFGGGGNVTDDLHFLDLKTMNWVLIQNASGTPPCKRYGHTATRWKDSIIIFGGCNEYQEYCKDIHIFNLKTSSWHQPTIRGTVCSRYLHSATVFEDKLLIYGGFAKSSDCTYVLDELCVLDLVSMAWTRYHDMPPRYNHSATLVGNKMYIYAGKDEQGNTVSDLFMINLSKLPYTPHLVLSGTQEQQQQSRMVLLKSQHFCDTACGKLLVFGRYLSHQHYYQYTKSQQQQQQQQIQQQQIQQQVQQQQQLQSNYQDSTYSLWMLDLDTLEWEKQECDGHFEVGGWNYFTIIHEKYGTSEESQVNINNLLFLGNTDPYRPQGYDHFRDALVIHGESLGLYDIAEPRSSNEFVQLLNSPELSDFSIIAAKGEEIFVHQVILLTRWPHFKHIHKSGMSEAVEKKMKIPEPVEVIMAFLKFLYSDRLDESEPWQVVCDLMVMANMYLLYRLKKICCERLFKYHLTIESCGLIFEKAILAEETGLKLLTLGFMFQNYGLILKSNLLMDLPPSVQQEFLDYVPKEAVLEVGRTRCLIARNQAQTMYSSMSTSSISTSHSNLIYLRNSSAAQSANTTTAEYYTTSEGFRHSNTQQTMSELIPIQTTNNTTSNSNDMTVEV
ncbi:Kelch domain-containing protein 3 [Choanephora cucurbitarum]|uniref:Kelch domain-containing protein 3 n=1 Tax=Choanephora cucurbitarum TaxID=101091 RepID=A0A1C7N8J2_9FUNG|nr:Kelch domain-containing protein 3 [Choanephora cucurbitarum]